jgi:hypothetical protein
VRLGNPCFGSSSKLRVVLASFYGKLCIHQPKVALADVKGISILCQSLLKIFCRREEPLKLIVDIRRHAILGDTDGM